MDMFIANNPALNDDGTPYSDAQCPGNVYGKTLQRMKTHYGEINWRGIKKYVEESSVIAIFRDSKHMSPKSRREIISPTIG